MKANEAKTGPRKLRQYPWIDEHTAVLWAPAQTAGRYKLADGLCAAGEQALLLTEETM